MVFPIYYAQAEGVQIVVNRVAVPVIQEATGMIPEETNKLELPDSNMITPMSTPGRRRSSAMSQIILDLSPISRSQKVELFIRVSMYNSAVFFKKSKSLWRKKFLTADSFKIFALFLMIQEKLYFYRRMTKTLQTCTGS